jgi:SAM-dependent methyltransferase
MMWFERDCANVVYGDRRREAITVPDRSHGKTDGVRTVVIAPDVAFDFRALPFADASFKLVAFDPPHLVRAGASSWLAAKYGKLSTDWRDDLRRGLAECFRVLEPEGVLVFKWNETQVPLSEVLALTPHVPLFGNTAGRRNGTHWIVFLAPNADDAPRISTDEASTGVNNSGIAPSEGLHVDQRSERP